MGMQRPDEGTILVEGSSSSFKSPRDAIAVGIGMVHQHVMLADNLTVEENVDPRRRARLPLRASTSGGPPTGSPSSARAYGLPVDPETLVAELGVGDRQRVEILKVLYRGARILILDEPTAVLVPQEVDELFASLRELTSEGVTIIFISHKLDEVLAVADAITVVRAGRTVAIGDAVEVTARDLAELMVGSELPTPETRESTVTDVVELEVAGLTVVEDVRRAARPRVAHSASRRGRRRRRRRGQRPAELVEALVGLRPRPGASRSVAATSADAGTRGAPRARLGYIPEDRQHDGLLLSSPLWENSMLGHQGQAPYAKGPWIDRARRRASAPRRSSTSSTSARPASTSPRTRSRAATSRSSSSGAKCSATRSCSSPPIPPEASMSARRPPCGRASVRPGSRALRCCSFQPTSRS